MSLLDQDKIEEDILEHFGVKGMKWGVTRSRKELSDLRQGYKDKRDARRETAALEYERQAGVMATRISELKAKNKGSTQRGIWDGERVANQVAITNLGARRERALEGAAAKREGRLTPDQKDIGKKIAMGAAAIAAYATYTAVQTGEMRRQIERGKAHLKGEKFEFKKDERLARTMSRDALHKEVVPAINPDFKKKYGTKMNCRRATFTYELRRRGMDVKATRTSFGRGQDPSGMINAFSPEDADRVRSGVFGLSSELWGEKAKKLITGKEGPVSQYISRDSGPLAESKSTGLLDLYDQLAKQPNGSRGEVGMMWRGPVPAGHSMAYEVVNNTPVIFDTQSGKRYDKPDDWWDDDSLPSIKDVGFTRLDDKPLDLNFLMRWARNND